MIEHDLETMAREHAHFLRRLAHALVGDHDGAHDLADGADDLAQDDKVAEASAVLP